MNGAPGPALPFPPLGAPGLTSIAAAAVGADPAFLALAEALRQVDPAAVRPVVDRFAGWLHRAITAANDARYHFELTGLHPDGLPPVVEDVDRLALPWLGAPTVARGRGTAKLVVLVGLDGPGRAGVTAVGSDGAVELVRGTMVVAPTFLVLGVERVEAGLSTLALAVEGPAFR